MTDRANDTSAPGQLIARALGTLDTDLRRVLIMHNGHGDTPGLSFEALEGLLNRRALDLAADEKRAIRNLRRPAAAHFIAEAVKRGDSLIWRALAGTEDVVNKGSLRQRIAASLPGELLIAIKCMHESVNNWLDNNAYQNSVAWYRSEYPEHVVEEAIRQLTKVIDRFQMPLPLALMAERLNFEEGLLNLVLALLRNKFELYRGYVCGPHARARSLRAVRIHLMFFYRYPDRILSLERIHTEYLETYPDDDAVSRDISLAMGDNPHLFVRLGDFGWYAFMTVAGPDPYLKKDITTRLRRPDENKAQFFFKRPDLRVSLPKLILEAVKSLKMARPREIEAFIREKHGDAAFNKGQIPPVVAGSGDLVQVAPGVYASRETHGNMDTHKARSEVLLTRGDLRRYVVSRYAGEPMNSFPLWTPAMEWTWCRWWEKRAINPADRRLLNSLIYVADPERWSAPDAEKKFWLGRKKLATYYLRRNPKYPIWSRVPSLRDLLALSICALTTDGMNWIRVNRTAGYYPFDHHSVSHLVMMIAVGALTPTDHWQKPHSIGEKAEPVFEKLRHAFQYDPDTNWDSDIGLDLRRHLSDPGVVQNLGWVKAEDLDLLSRTLSGTLVPLSVNGPEEPDSAPHPRPEQLELPFGLQEP